MKMKHAAVAAAAAGMLAFGSVFGVSAAGIGYVNMNEVMQSHPKMEKAQLDMKAAVQKAQDDLTNSHRARVIRTNSSWRRIFRNSCQIKNVLPCSRLLKMSWEPLKMSARLRARCDSGPGGCDLRRSRCHK